VRQPDIPAPVVPGPRPALKMPLGATDCHAHVFGPQARYPLQRDTHFVPHETPWPSYAAMLRSIGCQRAVLVQPSVYGTDNAAIEHTLQSAQLMPEVQEMELRAVAVVAPDVNDAELRRLHALGFRGVRINIASGTQGLRLEHAHALAERIAPLGWHLEFYADFHRHPDIGAVLAALPVTIVLDHFGRIRAQEGIHTPGFRAVLQLLERDNCWAKLTGPYFVSEQFPGYEDITPFARAMVGVAPNRIVWGTDWPHASARQKMQADADLVDLLAHWVPDPADRQRVLVDNPTKLYGFKESDASGDKQ